MAAVEDFLLESCLRMLYFHVVRNVGVLEHDSFNASCLLLGMNLLTYIVTVLSYFPFIRPEENSNDNNHEKEKYYQIPNGM